jgi:hypothetical protein
MSAERVEQANRVDIAAAKRTRWKVFLWTPDIAYLSGGYHPNDFLKINFVPR